METDFRKKVVNKKDLLKNAIKVNSNQMNLFSKEYTKYLDRLITASSVFAGVTEALLSSSTNQIKLLTAFGLLFQVICVSIIFYTFKKGLTISGGFSRFLLQTNKNFNNFNFKLTKFLRGETSSDVIKKEWDEFDGQFESLINNQIFSKIETEKIKWFDSLDTPYNEINIAFWLFVLGIFCVLISVIIPYLNIVL